MTSFDGRARVPNRFFVKQQAPMGDRHVLAARPRSITPVMLKHSEEATWLSAETQQ